MAQPQESQAPSYDEGEHSRLVVVQSNYPTDHSLGSTTIFYASPSNTWPPSPVATQAMPPQYPPRNHRTLAPAAADIMQNVTFPDRVDFPPPSYNNDQPSEPAPPYERINKNPETLARYLFRYGFLCPFFWVFGALILVSKLNPIPHPEELGKTAAEQAEELAIMRATELKWARRCLFALFIFTVAMGTAGYFFIFA